MVSCCLILKRTSDYLISRITFLFFPMYKVSFAYYFWFYYKLCPVMVEITIIVLKLPIIWGLGIEYHFKFDCTARNSCLSEKCILKSKIKNHSIIKSK